MKIQHANLAKRCRSDRSWRQKRAHRLSVSRNCFARGTFARAKIIRILNWLKPFPARGQRLWETLARKDNEIVIVASLFERAIRGDLSQYGGNHRCRRLASRESIARCISRTTRFTTKNFISRRAILGFPSFQTRYAKIGALVCWDQWFPEAPGSPHSSGAQILFYPTAIGWIPKEPRAVAQHQRNAWEIDPALPCGRQRCLCRCGKSSRARRENSNSGAVHLSPDRSARSLRTCGGERDEIITCQVRSRQRSKRHARVGPSCAIGALMPTALCAHASLSHRKAIRLGSSSYLVMTISNCNKRTPHSLGYSMPAEWIAASRHLAFLAAQSRNLADSIWKKCAKSGCE